MDHGTVLDEALAELWLGRMPETDTPLDLWPTISEPTPGNFVLGVKYGRSGGARTVGEDHSAVVFSPERGSLYSFRKTIDSEAQATALAIRGKGNTLPEFYIHSPSAYARVGAIEDSWRAPEALAPDELELEARLYLHMLKDGLVSFEGEIVEQPGMLYGIDVNIGDTITIYSGWDSFNETVVKDILGVRIRIPAPGYPRVTFLTGQFKRNPLADRARHGGGGGRSGGGGRPRQKSPQEDVDYCESGYTEIYGTDCTGPAVAESCGSKIQIDGIGPDIEVYAIATPTNTVDGDTCGGAIDKVILEIRGEFLSGAPEATGRVLLRTSTGMLIPLLAGPPIEPA